MMSEIPGKLPADAPARRRAGYEGARRCILLAEDDIDQRISLERLLRGLGFVVASGDSGEAALAVELASAPHLAILDISMPGISGWETAQRLRARHGEKLRILMLSANSEELHRPEFETPEHDMFLVKPVDFESLVDTIGDLLGLRWQWAGGAAQDAGQDAQAEPAALALSEAARAHLGRLRELLRIGHIRGIEAEIRALEEGCPEAGPLVRTLYDFLDRYDLAGMAKHLQGR